MTCPNEEHNEKLVLAKLLLSGKNRSIIRVYGTEEEAKKAFNNFKEEWKHLKGLK